MINKFENIEAGSIWDEFREAKLGDLRLEKRLKKVVERAAESPQLSFPNLFSTPAELEGAYRFFANENVDHQSLLSGHIAATALRCSQVDEVIISHDTSTISYRLQQSARKGMGPVNNRSSFTQGFFGHISIGVGISNGVLSRGVLGTLGFTSFARTGEKKTKRIRNLPLSPERESYRWLGQIIQVENNCGVPRKCIHTADREAESYDLIFDCMKRDYRFVFRLSEDRILQDSTFLFDGLRNLNSVSERDVLLGYRKIETSPKNRARNPPRKKRWAKLSISAKTLVIKKPRNLGDYLPNNLKLNFVRVWEKNPPEGEKAVEWFLATTEPIDTPEQIERVVDIYKARWIVEEYFKVLKTGCSLEKRQHEKLDIILKILAVFIPIARNLLNLRTLAEENPDLPSEGMLTEIQEAILKEKFPKECDRLKTVGGVLVCIAKLGGYIPSSGPAGWITINRGYRDLLLMELGVRIYLAQRGAISD